MLLNTNAQQYDYEQEYGQDYTQDSLYHDYAMKQQEKEVGKAWVGLDGCVITSYLGRWNVEFSFHQNVAMGLHCSVHFFKIEPTLTGVHAENLTTLVVSSTTTYLSCYMPHGMVFRPFGWSKLLIGTGIGWMVGGKVHAQRKEKRLNAKHKDEQKALYTQYYNDVYRLQQENAELLQALEQLGVRIR
jgi:hypothetical protein